MDIFLGKVSTTDLMECTFLIIHLGDPASDELCHKVVTLLRLLRDGFLI